MCSCDCTVPPEPWGHQNIPYRELWSAPLCRLHFPVQPNLSQRTKSCQIREDSYRSISSAQTCQLHGGRDYARGEGDSPISRLWGSLWLIRAALMSLYQCISVDNRHSKKHIYTYFQALAHKQQPILNQEEDTSVLIRLFWKCIIHTKLSLEYHIFDI